MKLSQKAWEISSDIIKAIQEHPFNQELMKGTLAKDKFAFYIEQDAIYLQDFVRCKAIIASRVPAAYIRNFLRYSDETFNAEQELVDQFFKEIYKFQPTGKLTPATISYTSYLLRVCSHELVEVAIAAILPCFWVYKVVGEYIIKYSNDTNPYAKWIATYMSNDADTSGNEAIEIFDTLAESVNDSTRQKMLDAFYRSTCLEWHFWNDAYHKIAFDDIKLIYSAKKTY